MKAANLARLFSNIETRYRAVQLNGMNLKQAKQTPLPLIIGFASLAAGALACLLYVLWPLSGSAGKEDKAASKVATAVANDTVAAGIPAGNPAPRPATGVTRPAGPELPARPTQTVRQPQQAKPLVLPNFKPENIIRNPPWRNGPPVRTPNPGKPTVASSQAPASPTSPAPPSPRAVTVAPSAAPNGATRNAPGQSLPYLPPARRLPTPTPFPPPPPQVSPLPPSPAPASDTRTPGTN